MYTNFHRRSAFYNIALAFFLTYTTQTLVSAALPIEHATIPSVLWNANIQSPPGNGDIVYISPDNAWLYITSSDGKLSKVDPQNGDYKSVYQPDKISNDWIMYGGRGLSFHSSASSSASEEEGGDDYLVYWVLDVPKSTSSGDVPSSRVIAVKHDASSVLDDFGTSTSSELNVLWEKSLRGTISGTPVIGSDGKYIYFTMNSPAESSSTTPSTANNNDNSPPTLSPVTTAQQIILDISDGASSLNNTAAEEEDNLFVDETVGESDETTSGNPAFWWAQDVGDGRLVCGKSSTYPEEYLTNDDVLLFTTIEECCDANTGICGEGSTEDDGGVRHNIRHGRHRNLQNPEKSGKFIILSGSDGELVYEFDSRSELSIQNHNFAPVGIAHNPSYGNYNGGQDNTNDVIMWGSGRGGNSGSTSGETMLFQLPANQFNGDLSKFKPRVMESVSWTTSTPPTFSSDGLDVYFAVSDNRIVGWNEGRKFDVVSNYGPKSLPFGTDGIDDGASRPIVLANDDELLLIGSTDNYALFAVDAKSEEIVWTLEALGREYLMTIPRISPDGSRVYFGKKNRVQSVNVTDGTEFWRYSHPSNTDGDAPMLADFTLSENGEYLYYSRSGSSISALEVASVMPTPAPVSPTVSPSQSPVIATSKPSMVPSSSSSMPPSASNGPTTTNPPTLSTSPTIDPDFIYPSSSPSISLLPSSTPSISQTPTEGSPPPSKLSSSETTTDAPATSFESVWGTFPPTESKPTFDNPTLSSTGDLNSSTNTQDEESSSSLGMTAIIGIAVGGGIGLILMLGAICYICKKKKGGDDGVDRDWAASNTSSQPRQDDGTQFQYDVEDSHHQRYSQGGADAGPLQW